MPRLTEPRAVDNEVRDNPPEPLAPLIVVPRKRLPPVHLRAEGASTPPRASKPSTIVCDADLPKKLREKVLQVVVHRSPPPPFVMFFKLCPNLFTVFCDRLGGRFRKG